jgi:dCTP deaminase
MILADQTIRHCLSSGEICITPPTRDEDIRPIGVRIHLGSGLLIPPEGRLVDPMRFEHIEFHSHALEEGMPYILKRGSFVLGGTREAVRLSRELTCHIDGRSTLARLGLIIHCTSSTFDNVHDESRVATLELANIGPFDLQLSLGMPIGMLVFTRLTAAIHQDSQDQYRGQAGPAAPNLHFKPK